MIDTIGVLCQDPNSFGFLDGIGRRLKCEATLVEPTTGSLAKSTLMSRRQAKLAAADLRRKGVDLILRFTDADRNRWQTVRRHEQKVFPSEVQSVLVCGVAVENVEQWLALDIPYLEQALDLSDLGSRSPDEQTGLIKHAIANHRRDDEPVSEVTARIVADAPTEVFRRWLRSDDSLGHFYADCRAAALRQDCGVPNELEN